MKKVENKCYNCVYKSSIPGDAHIRCCFDWGKSGIEKPTGHPTGIKKGWFMFPYNYDPVWMIGECKQFSER